MKPHLPVRLVKSVLACLAVVSFSVGSGAAGAADSAVFILGAEEVLTIDYADASTLPVVDGVVQLLGGTQLHLSSCGEGDGKTYTLLTGVSGLLDAAGNALSLDASNNAIASYFDTTQLGTAFWADGILQLKNGALQVVLHQETVESPIIVPQRQQNAIDCQYYKSVEFIEMKNFDKPNTGNAGPILGGAIYQGYGDISVLSNNGKVSFRDNACIDQNYFEHPSTGELLSYGASGGAVYGSIILEDNGSVEFCDNSVTSAYHAALGGAIEGSRILLRANDDVLFSGNTASGPFYPDGGAISVSQQIEICDNGSVTFCGNAAGSGGAIYGWSGSIITLSGNGSVIFSENTGGAIYAGWDSDGHLSIRNNDAVLFEKNAEIVNGTYRLRSIYISAWGGGNAISLSAAEVKSIEFRDSLYISSGSTVEFNADYTDAAGVVHAQKGDIIFTGATTEADLLAVKGSAGTAEEIRLSRTSEVQAMTNLYGGRLRVEDGAVYRGRGITAMAGSEATVRVKDGTLEHSGYDLIFNAGTTLEIGGISEINGNVELLSGSMLTLWESSTMKLSEDSLLKAETGARIHLENDATLDLAGKLEAGESVMVELAKGAAVSRAGISIGNMGGADVALLDAGSFASGNMQKVENVHVVIDNNEDTNIDYQLVNSSVENRGSGKLTVSHAQNSITAVRSEGGAIDILKVDTSDAGTVLKLATLELHEGATLGVYTGDTVDAAQEAWVQVSGSAVFGKGTTINADLELMEGCSLTLGGTVDMGSNLRINGTLTLDGELLAQIQAAEIGASFDLFTGIDNLYLSGVQYDSIALSDGMAASTYFVGLEDSLEAERGYRLTYASATPGEGVLSVHVVTIPEPTTATLSFLALAGLMLRRRRK